MDARRVRALRPDAALPSESIWAEPSTVDGVTYRESVQPGPDREAAIEKMKTELRVRAGGLNRSVSQLRDLVGCFEPVEFVTAVAAPAAMGFGRMNGLLDDGAETHTWPAKIEYLLGIALSVPPGHGSTPLEVTSEAIELLADVFDAANAQHMVESFDRPLEGSDSLGAATFLLRQEHLTDRMPGYPIHTEMIDAEVFDRNRDFYVATVGFNPADVTRVVRRRRAAVAARFDAARQLHMSANTGSDVERATATGAFLDSLNDVRIWTPVSVGRDSGIAVEEVALMLRFFSTTFGSQPDFRLPSDQNVARSRPCVQLSDDGYEDLVFVADPWSLSAAVHLRLAEVLEGRDLDRYRGHREKGHERLVGGALRTVFGPAAIGSQHYVGRDARGEVDELVTSEWPLVVEAKAHSLTPSGRRGAPKRVLRVADSTIGQAMGQTARARDYILVELGRAFSKEEGGEQLPVLPDVVVGLEEIIVTFERMDPLALEGAGVVGEEDRRLWTLCIADLLMLTDILDDPAAFHHYARRRRETRELGVMIYVESDALGGYLIDRLTSQIEAARANPGSTVSLGYTSWSVNDYFNRVELGLERVAPSTGVPVDVQNALAEMWLSCCFRGSCGLCSAG